MCNSLHINDGGPWCTIESFSDLDLDFGSVPFMRFSVDGMSLDGIETCRGEMGSKKASLLHRRYEASINTE